MSAIVLATLRILKYPLAESDNLSIAIAAIALVSLFNSQYFLISSLVIWALHLNLA
jgi:hypothetical protein